MPQLHPTAHVDPGAELAEDVIVGPGCVIEAGVRIGRGTKLTGNVWLRGPLTLGERNVLYPNVVLGFEPQDRKFDPETDGTGIVIGHDNVLREGVTIHRATGDRPTTVGDHNYLMCNSHLGHDVILGNDNLLANGTLIGGHAEVADEVVFGGNATVHQFCRIGRLAMMSGVAGITQDLPPFCLVYKTRLVGSLNIVGLRRAGYRGHVAPLKRAFDIFFCQKLSNESALRKIRSELQDDPLCQEFAHFISQAERGICPYGG